MGIIELVHCLLLVTKLSKATIAPILLKCAIVAPLLVAVMSQPTRNPLPFPVLFGLRNQLQPTR